MVSCRRFVERGGFGWFCGGRSLSVAAFWAGAAHPRRQKHRGMPPPGASAPAFAATAEPAQAHPHVKHPRQDASSTRDERVLGDVLRARAEDGLLRASILDFKPRLGNRCRLFPVYPLFHASILDFKPRLGNRCMLFSVYPLFRALILDFKPKLANRCKLFPV